MTREEREVDQNNDVNTKIYLSLSNKYVNNIIIFQIFTCDQAECKIDIAKPFLASEVRFHVMSKSFKSVDVRFNYDLVGFPATQFKRGIVLLCLFVSLFC